MKSFENFSNQTKQYFIVIVISAILFLYFGFKSAGSVYYNGNSYDAGSVFNPAKYTDYGASSIFEDNEVLDGLAKSVFGDPDELNGQIKQLRRKNLIIVLISGAVAVSFLVLAIKSEGEINP